jgi:hypothetical protein
MEKKTNTEKLLQAIVPNKAPVTISNKALLKPWILKDSIHLET